jgi:hypothetical protein
LHEEERFAEPRSAVIVAALAIAIAGTGLGGYWHWMGKSISEPATTVPISTPLPELPGSVGDAGGISASQGLAQPRGEPAKVEETPVQADAKAQDAAAAPTRSPVAQECSDAVAALALCSESPSEGD